ncbi:MAG: ATP-binding protein [Pseudotabrizicola sp.]|uniref:ATP-binding protein n=1 Tax=Pseudotabrizicola sp. TaxID=2939647 RepID=UPI00271F3913|nr:ATP-binding protein [Pseudotabrizicola sp.]MDO9639051.1 ATP-binding protein [Pseudotabrizicola sp.]
MSATVEISVVVLIAATMAVFALLICLLERRTRSFDADLNAGSTWLSLSNVAMLTAAVTLLFHESLPFWLGSSVIICGAHFGILFGFFAMYRGLGGHPRYWLFASVSVVNVGLQWGLVLSGTAATALFITTSVANGTYTLIMALIILRLSKPFERELRVLVCFPFFVLFSGYLLRLTLLASGAPFTVHLTSTALIAFALAYSALQWSFGLIALRAARLNQSLSREQQRTQELADSRARFLAHMSHEIRTPLNSVIGLADVLQGLVKQPEARKLIGHIQHSGDLLIHILNDILDVSKLQANAVTLETRPFDPGALLDQIRACHDPRCQARGITLTVDLAPEAAGDWLGDGHRVNQILQNVVGNAVKFTEAGTIRASVSGTDQLQIVVEDTGIGMTEAQVFTLFDEFNQADEGITRRFGGTGLGMTIVHQLVTAMGGTIAVESQQNIGTRFTISLPLDRAAPAVQVPADPVVVPLHDFSAMKVLCADDSAVNLLVLRAMLRQLGIEPQIAEDGHAAIRISEEQAFDIYLLDISMPGFSGIETLHRLRQLETDQRRAPGYAVAATANALPTDLALYIASGFDAHLPKPIRLEALRAVLLACQAQQRNAVGPSGLPAFVARDQAVSRA